MSQGSLDRLYAKYAIRMVLRRDGVSYNVKALPDSFSSESGIDEVIQDEEHFKISIKSMKASGFPYPPKKGDKAIADGRTRNIFSAQPLRYQGETIEYKVKTRG